MITRLFLPVIAAGLMVGSCGDDGTGPSVPDLTASTITLEFTGDSSKIGEDFSTGITLQEASALPIREFSDGSKDSCEVTVSWTICPESSFDRYILYRSETPGISSSPSSAKVLGVFTDPNDSEFIDKEVDWATEYYYALGTSDAENNTVWSNEDSITTPGSAPTPSALAVDTVTAVGVDLLWSQCPESDFYSYRLYRSGTPDIESDTTVAELVYAVTAVDSTAYADTDVEQDSTYYYALMTTNTKGFSSWSNEIEVVVPQVELPEGMEFVTIPTGSFEMGAPAGEVGGSSNERPVHAVTFDYSFEMMTTEVTQAMWEEVMGSNPAHDYGVGDDYPVYYVSWNDCQDFVDAMNELDPDHEYRLPSEAEWEYCCRAGITTRFYWGDDPGETEIGDYAWWSGNSNDATHSVAEKVANDWGLYDMSGNVYEWCEDWYHSSYNGAPSDGSPWLEPEGSERIVRGGSFQTDAQFCRSANRGNYGPGDSGIDLGLRLARSER